MDWYEFLKIWNGASDSIVVLDADEMIYEYGVYKASVNVSKRCSCFIARDISEKFLVVTGGSDFDKFNGEIIEVAEKTVKKCPLSVYNSTLIQKIFEFTNPVPVGERPASIGLGDRLGRASAGHLRLIKGTGIFPVLAQQSIRELNLTGRNYNDVLASAVWAVLQEGFKDGYGADGDHLKTHDEVKMALDCGFTMITLDCSEHIDNDIYKLADDELYSRFENLGKKTVRYWESGYLGNNLSFPDLSIDRKELIKTVLVYADAIDFAEEIYKGILKNYGRQIDFEISIDETLTSTSTQAHYIIASEFKKRDVLICNMAPRFCGEFQKGIDYRGDIREFTDEFKSHSNIADNFGYRLSIHSGSDKFSVFPIIGDLTNGRLHIKTAGTNWLEAMRVIAAKNPDLFISMYLHAKKRLPDAKKFYHIGTESDMVPDVYKYNKTDLPELLNLDESRQLIHVTYGYLLCDTDETGEYIFRDVFFETLHNHEETYYNFLINHIGRHLEKLKLI